MTMPGLDGFIAGEKVTAEKLNRHTKDSFNAAVYFKPYCRITNSATQTFATGGTLLDVIFNTTLEDTASMADTANNRIVIKTAGLYRISAQAVFATNATGVRLAAVLVNGVGRFGANQATLPTFPVRWHMGSYERLNLNDAITMKMAQNSGAALATDTTYRGVHLAAEFISL